MATRSSSQQTKEAEPLIAGTTYRAISLHPPWAWAIMHGGKDVENRSFPTKHRGRLLIHASSRQLSPDDLEDRREAIAECGGLPMSAVPHEFMPSAILGWVDLIDCVEDADSAWAIDGEMHWVLRNPHVLTKPIMGVKGRQKLWSWTPTARDLASTASLGAPRKSEPTVTPTTTSPAIEPAPAQPASGRSIEDLSSDEILRALSATANAGPANEADFLRATSRQLGFARMGARVEKNLKRHLRTAVRRHILSRDGDKIRAAT